MSGEARADAATLDEQLAAIVDSGRAAVAGGRDPDEESLRERVRAAVRAERAIAAGESDASTGRAERRTLEQIAHLGAVHRARALVARRPEPPTPQLSAEQPPPAATRTRLRTRPTISGNMDVRRLQGDDTPALEWDRAPTVVAWEARFSTRPSPRADYALDETVMLPGEATSVPVPLGERPLRVHLLGRGRDGRVLRRAMLSGLVRETWAGRWERRATAS